MSNINIKISENIRNLRKAHGETQEELSKIIGVVNTTISNYENGTNFPNTEILNLIASHYGITIDDLMNKDYSNVDYRLTVSRDNILTFFDIFLPVIYSEKALENIHFLKGYEYTKNIFSKLKNNSEEIMDSEIRIALEEYELSLIDNETLIESVANILVLYFIIYSSMPDEHIEKINYAINYGKSNNKDFVKKYVLKDVNPTSQINLNEKKNYIIETQETILSLISMLKQSAEYYELADYYIALRYTLCMVDNVHTDEQNKTFGIELLFTFANMGNKYAFEFLNTIKKW